MSDSSDNPKSEIRIPQSDVLAIHPGAVGDVVLLGHLLARLGGRAAVVAKGQRGRLLGELTFSPPGAPQDEAENQPDAAGGGKDRSAKADSDADAAGHRVYPLAERVIDFDTWLMEGRVVLRSTGRRPEHFLGHCHRLIAFYPPTEPEVRRLARATQAQRHWLLPIRPSEDYEHHLLDLWAAWMDMKPIVGPDDAGKADRPVWRISRERQAAARSAIAPLGVPPDQPFVLLHPGSGGRIKCWPLENFVSLARRLADRDVRVLMVVGEAEIDRWPADNLRRLAQGFPLLRCDDLVQLAALLAQARAYLGNDSGPSHLAAALGTPTIALFGATNPVHFAPVGPAVRVIQGETMAGIGVDEVEAEVRSAIEEERNRE